MGSTPAKVRKSIIRKLCGVPSCVGGESAAEIEEGLPANKAPRRSGKATQINEIGAIVARRVKDHTEERLSIITVEIRDARSKVISWSRNWPRNVTPAV